VTSLVQTAAASRVVAATAPSRAAAEFEITTDETVDEAWLVANAGAHGADESSRVRLAVYARLLARLGPRAAAVALRLPDIGAAAAGFVVVERGWAGIFGMGTNPAARRRGVATAILHALAQHARDHGAAQLYLQVEEDNDPALALYARAGFAPAYRYHYRSLGVRELHG